MWSDEQLIEVIHGSPAAVDDALRAIQQDGGTTPVDLDAFTAAAGVLGADPARLCIDQLRARGLLAAFQAALLARGIPAPTPEGNGHAAPVTRGGPPRPVTRLTEGGVDDYLWSPDGKRLVLKRTLGDVGNLWSAGTDGRPPQPITDFATGLIFAIDAAQDGKTLYFLYGNLSLDIVLLKGFR